MRASIAIMLSIVIIFIGVVALSNAAQQTEQAAANDSQTAEDIHNTTTQTYEGLGQAFSPALVWGGIGTFVLVALGALVNWSGGGR